MACESKACDWEAVACRVAGRQARPHNGARHRDHRRPHSSSTRPCPPRSPTSTTPMGDKELRALIEKVYKDEGPYVTVRHARRHQGHGLQVRHLLRRHHRHGRHRHPEGEARDDRGGQQGGRRHPEAVPARATSPRKSATTASSRSGPRPTRTSPTVMMKTLEKDQRRLQQHLHDGQLRRAR